MLQPLQIQDVSVRYANEIAELRDFLAKAGLRLDTAATLQSVTGRLRENRSFRRDLTSHVWVVLHDDSRQVSRADLLAMLAVAATGPQLAAEAGDTEAHDLLRYVMQVWNAFGASPAADLQPRRSAMPVIAAASQPQLAAQPIAPVSFARATPSEREMPLSLDMPHDAEGQRRIAWISVAVCLVVALLVGVALHHHAAPNAGIPAPVVASAAPDAAPAVLAMRDQGQYAANGSDPQRTPVGLKAARRDTRSAPYSRLPESSMDLPPAGMAAHAKPAAGIPMPVARPAAASRASSRIYARSSHAAAPAVKPRVAPASGQPTYVPKVVPVDSFQVRGAPGSAGTLRQAIVRPTSLGIMAGNVTYSPAPRYPAAASAARVQGEVKIEAEVGRDGTVASTRVISGPPLLADAAADAVQHWRYRPYLYEGKPIAMNAQIVMDFQLP